MIPLEQLNAPGASSMPKRAIPAAEAGQQAAALVDKRAVAKATGVSVRTVDAWIAQKKIPVVRLSPRCVRFNLAAVLRALARFEVKEVGA